MARAKTASGHTPLAKAEAYTWPAAEEIKALLRAATR